MDYEVIGSDSDGWAVAERIKDKPLAGNILYDNITTPEEANIICALCNEGYHNREWEVIEPLVKARMSKDPLTALLLLVNQADHRIRELEDELEEFKREFNSHSHPDNYRRPSDC